MWAGVMELMHERSLEVLIAEGRGLWCLQQTVVSVNRAFQPPDRLTPAPLHPRLPASCPPVGPSLITFSFSHNLCKFWPLFAFLSVASLFQKTLFRRMYLKRLVWCCGVRGKLRSITLRPVTFLQLGAPSTFASTFLHVVSHVYGSDFYKRGSARWWSKPA